MRIQVHCNNIQSGFLAPSPHIIGSVRYGAPSPGRGVFFFGGISCPTPRPAHSPRRAPAKNRGRETGPGPGNERELAPDGGRPAT